MSKAAALRTVEAFEAEVQAEYVSIPSARRRSGKARSRVMSVDLPKPKGWGGRTAALYLRLSRDPNAGEIAISRQLVDSLRIAEAHGWWVTAVYIDDDVSAFLRSVKRNAYLRLVDDLRAATVNAVVFWDIDRFWRQPRELEALFDVLDDAALDVLAASAGSKLDLSDENARLQMRLLVAIAYKSSADTRRRVKRAKEDGAARGLNSGGPRPFGYNADRLTTCEPEALVLKRAASMILDGHSLHAVTKWLHDDGVRGPNGNGIDQTYLKRVLISDRVAGWCVSHGERTVRAQWPAILDDETSESLRALFADPARDPGGRMSDGSQKYGRLVLGLAHCGRCGARLSGGVRRSGRTKTLRPVYACDGRPGRGGCFGTTRSAERVDAHIAERVIARLSQPDFLSALRATSTHDDDVTAKARRVASLTKRLDSIADAFGDGELTRAQAARATARVTPLLDAERAALATMRAVRAGSSLFADLDLADTFAERSADERAAITARLIERVTLLPQPIGISFDPTCVEIIWRSI